MPIIELPEFGSNQTNENEPTTALKRSGWTDGDQPPASVQNWITRTTYDSVRGVLGMAFAAAVKDFNPLSAASTASLRAFEIDRISGHVLTSRTNTTSTNTLHASADGGITWSLVHTDASASTDAADAVAIVDGVYAVAMSSTGNFYYYAAYPYTGTWTKVPSMAWGGNIVDYMTADIGDGHGPSLLVLTDAGSIWVASAGSAPTTTGAWTEYDISSVIAAPVAFALDAANGYLVVIGGSASAYCAVADGVAAGDFATASTDNTDYVAHNGERFAAVEDHSGGDDISFTTASPPSSGNWSLFEVGLDTVWDSLTPTNAMMFADAATGMFFLAAGETASAAARIACSRDGVVWRPLTATGSQNLYIDGRRGTCPKVHPVSKRIMAITYNAVSGGQVWLMATI